MNGPFNLDQVVLWVDALLDIELLQKRDGCLCCRLSKHEIRKSLYQTHTTFDCCNLIIFCEPVTKQSDYVLFVVWRIHTDSMLSFCDVLASISSSKVSSSRLHIFILPPVSNACNTSVSLPDLCFTCVCIFRICFKKNETEECTQWWLRLSSNLFISCAICATKRKWFCL